MLYRNLRQRSTGRWLNTLFTFEKDDPQNTKAQVHAEQIATGWGIAPADLEVLDSPVDMRSGVLLNGPTVVPPPDPAIAIDAAAADVVTEIDKAFTVRSTKLTDIEKAAMKDKVLNLIARAQGW